MPINLIEEGDKLRSGFRVKYNNTVAEMPSADAAIDPTDGKPYLPLFGGGKRKLTALLSLFYTKSEVQTLLSQAGLSTSNTTRQGTVERATNEEAYEGVDTVRYITPNQLHLIVDYFFNNNDAYVDRLVPLEDGGISTNYEAVTDFHLLINNGAYKVTAESWDEIDNNPSELGLGFEGLADVVHSGDMIIIRYTDSEGKGAIKIGVGGTWLPWRLDGTFATGSDAVKYRVGAVDETTGLYRQVTLGLNEYGHPVDWDDNNLETVWFKARGELSELAQILQLYPWNTQQTLPLVAQNGESNWWTDALENFPDAPEGLTGYGDINTKTNGKFFKVLISNNGGEAYNYTSDLSADPIVWSGWKYTTHLLSVAETGKIFKASGKQTMGQANLWANEDGTFSMGQLIQYTSALFSIAGRMAGHDPLLPDDFVTLRRLLAETAKWVTSDVFNAFVTTVNEALASKANTGHTHAIGEITGLVQALADLLPKSVFGGGQPYFALVRDADGNATLADLSGCRLLIEELPAAQRGVAYSYTITAAQFVWPFGSVGHEVSLVSAAKVRGSQGWISITDYNTSTGNTLSGTPPTTPDYESETQVVVIMACQLHATAKRQEWRFPLPLAIYPTTASIVSPNPVLSFVAETVSAYEIALTWVDDSSNESGFEIDYRIDDTGDWTRLITKAANSTAHNHTGLTPETAYYYRIRSINSAGESAYEYTNATTSAVVIPPVFTQRWVTGTGRLKNIGTVTPPIDPPVTTGGDFYGTGRPKIDVIMQSNAAIQTDWITWRRKSDGALAVFAIFDQNNNPSQSIPDAETWEIADISEASILIDRARRAGFNGITFALRWELMQPSSTRYMFEIPRWLAKRGWELGVKVRFLLIPGIGNGSRPPRPDEPFVGGQNQAAEWRYLLDDVEKAMLYPEDGIAGVSSPTSSYGKSLLPPSLFSTRAKTNFKALYTAFCNAMKTDTYRSAIHNELELILSPTGETHIAIDDGKWAPASQMTLQAFWNFVQTLSASKKALFGDFVNDFNQRNFIRGWVPSEAYQIFDWWMQAYYMTPYQQELGDIARAAGFMWAANHGSLSDHSNDRVNKFFLAAPFLVPYDEVKHNPAGGRYLNKEYGGAIEQHIARAAGKLAAQELTPGALSDFGNSIPTAIAACTKGMQDAHDAGAHAIFLSFVSDEDKAMNIAKPIIDAYMLTHGTLPKQVFSSVQNINVDLNYLFGKGWYSEGDTTAQPVKDMDDAIASLVAGGMSRRQAIQRVGFTILPTQNPTANTPTLPNSPIIEWVHRTSSTAMQVRYTNNHTATALIEIQAKEVGTSEWYTMKNDGTLVLSTGSPMQLSTAAGSSSTLNTTLSFYSGKVMEFRARAVVGSLSSPWSNSVSE